MRKALASVILALIIIQNISTQENNPARRIAALGLGIELSDYAPNNFTSGAVLCFDYNLPMVPLALGLNAAGSTDFSGFFITDFTGFFRWYFADKKHEGPFLHAGLGGKYDFSGQEKPMALLADLRGGFRLPLGKNFYLEQYGSIRYAPKVSQPFSMCLGVIGGIRLPLIKDEAKVKTEIEKETVKQEEKKQEAPPAEISPVIAAEPPVEEKIPEEPVIEKQVADIASRFVEIKGSNTTVERTDEGIKISLQKMQFLPNSAALHESELWKVEEAAKILSSIPNVKILITGHTARAGTAEMSKRVSQERADYVAKYLADLGAVKPENIKTIGYGHDRPIADNNTLEGMATNRRIEIIILDK